MSTAIAERGGYTLMPEAGTRPANHYLPRRRNAARIDAQQLVRERNPLRVEGREPLPAQSQTLGADWEH